jgi:hypothetical protein
MVIVRDGYDEYPYIPNETQSSMPLKLETH